MSPHDASSPQINIPGAAAAPAVDECMSCGSHLARRWSTPQGTAVLCRECATLHGLGCP